MSELNTIQDFKSGMILRTKKGKKIEVISVKPDFAKGLSEQEVYDSLDEDEKKKFKWGMGSVEVKIFVHRDSENITPKEGKGYGWEHNTKFFKSHIRLDGGAGLLRMIQKEGYKLHKK